MVVGDNGLGFNTSSHKEISEACFEFGLTSLEVISDDEDFLFIGKFLYTWDKGILWGTVDITAPFKDGGNGVDG